MMKETIGVDGMQVVNDVVEEMFGTKKKKGRVKLDVNVEHVSKMENEEVKEVDCCIEHDSMTENEEYTIDPELESQPSPKMPEQGEELEVMPLADMDSEPEISTTDPPSSLSVPELEYHELALKFIRLPASQLQELADDIEKNGLLEKIELLDGKILDGINRYLGLRLKSVDPETIRKDFCQEYKGTNPACFVLSKNVYRRHLNLTDSQRAMLVADMETYTHGGNRKNQDGSIHVETREELAEAANVSSSLVAQAKKIKESSPDEAQDIRDGKITVGTVIKEIRKKKKERNEPIKGSSTRVESSEWVQTALKAWWTNPIRKHSRKTPLEMVQYAIAGVQRVIDDNLWEHLLANLKEVETLALAGGMALTEEKINSVFATSETPEDTEWIDEMLENTLQTIQVVNRDVLQTWSGIQKGSTDWTPFDGLPQVKKGLMHPDEVAHTMIYVLHTAHATADGYKPGWSKEKIIETVVAIVGDITTQPITTSTVDDVASDCIGKEREKKYKKHSRAVSKWLRECKGVDIPEA